MKTYATDTDVTVSVAFTRNSQPALIDAGSAKYTVLAPSGETLAEGPLTTGPTDFSVDVTIPAELNAITTSFSKRTILVEATSGGQRLERREHYRLVPFAPHTVAPGDVRKYLGANESELPDEDIDVTKAYLELEVEVGRVAFRAALISGEEPEMRANDAILYKSALNVIPSLELRIAKQEQDGQIAFQRNAIRDFRRLASETRDRLSASLALITTRTPVPFSILVVTSDPDPVTG